MPSLLDFLSAVCGDGPGWFEIRALLEPSDKRLARSFWFPSAGKMVAWGATCGRRVNETHGLFFGVCLRDKRSGCNVDVPACASAWADLDWKMYPGGKDEATSALRSITPKPSAVVCSGGGFHAYWTLTAPLAPENSRTLNKRLAAELRSDPAVVNPSRVMRLPGSIHRKNPDNLKPVKLLALHPERRYDLAAFDAMPVIVEAPRLPATPPPPGGWPESGREARYASRVLVCVCERLSCAGNGEKHPRLFREAINVGRFVGAGLLEREETIRWLLYAIDRAGAKDLHGAETTIRDGFNKGEREIPRFPWNSEAA